MVTKLTFGDWWVGEGDLKSKFSEFFRLITQKSAYKMGSWMNGRWVLRMTEINQII